MKRILEDGPLLIGHDLRHDLACLRLDHSPELIRYYLHPYWSVCWWVSNFSYVCVWNGSHFDHVCQHRSKVGFIWRTLLIMVYQVKFGVKNVCQMLFTFHRLTLVRKSKLLQMEGSYCCICFGISWIWSVCEACTCTKIFTKERLSIFVSIYILMVSRNYIMVLRHLGLKHETALTETLPRISYLWRQAVLVTSCGSWQKFSWG